MEHLKKKIKDDAARKLGYIEEIKTWPAKLKIMEEREKHPMNEAEFCRTHGINRNRFNRLKKGSEAALPSEKFFIQVRSAFEKEKV